MTLSPAATFAHRLVDAFIDLGVRHAVVSPGSRSQALALALADAETRGRITLHVRIDERVAAFTALGLARESGMPALVVTTSGTAVANLLPAVVEASHSGVPMIVLSGDRPAHLRGTGSNQTTWQPGLFGRFTRLELDVPPPTLTRLPDARALAARTLSAARPTPAPAVPAGGGHAPRHDDSGRADDGSTMIGAGPVHLNLQFVEPLSGDVLPEEATVEDDPATASVDHPGGAVAAGAAAPRTVHLDRGPRTLVIAGADAGERANAFALHAGLPLIAEVSSGARFGPNLVSAYRTLLDHPDFGGRVERAVVFGHPTLSRQVPALLARDDVETIVVRGHGEAVVPHPETLVVDVITADPDDRSDRAARAWTGQWVFAGRELLEEQSAADDVAAPLIMPGGSADVAGAREYAKAELAALRAPVTRRFLADAVWRATWPHDRLVLGASRLIREVDAAVGGKKIVVHANRGLAGIDGTVSTAIGIALAAQTGSAAGGRTGTTRVLLGDVTLLHDAGGLNVPPGEPRPRVQLVVGNDGGGTIFDGLEVAGTAARDPFDRVMFTPQNVDLAALAQAFGWSYRTVSTRGDLDSALASPPAGFSLLEVPLPR
ncbi:2-succinyl-5-enolpyruvyl-6-hydroxy-3-cyclohexene-1-carboxylate synthase [Herbiconiux flava]|uniref:2-succinyl-5-enolpyruvyl-6-hydroxy-3-cyclohexene-1-carboxylate synthase n=1 Tax=Herbiconiux flava TaxID=881268 RepID=A0A852SMI7_9MICO|nr:thiamine pyrophosphate-binding protein [Herbiconiux flava]NYD70027.1 2-succinyl-5-enolpyruvyl-6-hydroxy-3-cyclohexene-1-carboxylate synthase [Herbiconiux flava]GLK16776.1 2-succinyl-5-enolpyruvyl-6-hydroxy-3-cyclohexene- 1-carboxylate synthase [Herbiconiux flava]